MFWLETGKLISGKTLELIDKGQEFLIKVEAGIWYLNPIAGEWWYYEY